MTPLEEAVQKLQALGSADQIALFLEQQGVKGRRTDAFRCPITNYLMATVKLDDDFYSLSTAPFKVSIVNPFGQRVERVETGGTPVSEFVSNFDAKNYPNLMENTDELTE